MAECDVLIIGAGAAGLAAARTLSNRGLRTIVLESSSRVGGRIHTIADDRFPLPVELGAEFIHGRPDETLDLANEAGAIIIHLPHEHWEKRGKFLKHVEFGEELALILKKLNTRGRDTSFADFLARRCNGNRLRNECVAARAFIEGFEAADPQRISVHALARELGDDPNFEHQPQHRLLQGQRQLLDHLLDACDPNRVDVRLNTRVVRIDWTPGRVKAGCMVRGRSKAVVTATAAIITVPVSAWHESATSWREGVLQFDPELPEKQEAAAKIALGSVVKVALAFREPVWLQAPAVRASQREEFASALFLHAPRAEFPSWWTQAPLQSPMLTAWAGGPKADALDGLSGSQIVKIALKALSELVGLGSKSLESMLIASHACNWSSVPDIHGAYSYELVGAEGARKALARPIERTLYFAGEATSQDQSATVAGALESGCRAGIEVVSSGRGSGRRWQAAGSSIRAAR